MKQNIDELFPISLRPLFISVSRHSDEVCEIRLRINQPTIIKMQKGTFYLDQSGRYVKSRENSYCITSKELLQVLNHVCHDSVYAFEEEIRKGYLTLPGGNRLGIVGQTVMENNKIMSIKNISSMNLRIAHQIIGAADRIMKYLYKKERVRNICIISPPGCGKTTLLRDAVRQLSDGTYYGTFRNVCIVDERSEIAGCYMGVPQNNVGFHTDVLDACPKAEGMMQVLRSMSPDVIAVDEIGSKEDFRAIQEALYCGCSIIATAHAYSVREFLQRPLLNEELGNTLFDLLILLSKREGAGTMEAVYEYEEGGYVKI